MYARVVLGVGNGVLFMYYRERCPQFSGVLIEGLHFLLNSSSASGY